MIGQELNRQKLQLDYDSKHNQLERNTKGQFATPYELALQITRDALSRVESPERFLEPSCGTGAFISAFEELNSTASITGIEKDVPVFEIADELWRDSRTEVINANFFDTVETLPAFDLLVTNPPYSRHHHLSSAEKKEYGAIAGKMSGIKLSQLAGLHAYFILAGTMLLKSEGIASWLIPSELFSVNYGKKIKEFITSEVTVERIHFFDNDDLQFSDALVSSCVLVIRRKKPSPETKVQITAGRFDAPSKSDYVTVEELTKIEKWQHYFNHQASETNATIGDYFKVKRGLSTGAESFYTREREEWHKLGIDDEWLIPVLPAPRYMRDNIVATDENGWPKDYGRALLSIPNTCNEEDLPASLMDYLDSCPSKVRNGYTATHRKKWYSVEQREPAPIVCTYMSRSNDQPFRFVRNKTRAVVTTAYLGLYPKHNLSDEQIDRICSSLNSISADTLISSGREYGGGLRKLEPKELLSVPFDFN
ncbi:N-6 DNA methylase [Berryella wangjianweii]|uniref:site-specific DNA-methyltransferase (adenine-specific) n=1 Tax=Berryella wangjianweii TaxID=2734634 RepID=A0A6M8J0K7_9ACTN|nr:N-6 DNA methylase [Berryella wangjianweii]QKF07064.1 N-6 DNA methylase [Berryella wangjianweii]